MILNTPTNDNNSGNSSDNNSSDSDLSTSTLAPPMTKRLPGPREIKGKKYLYGLFAPGMSQKDILLQSMLRSGAYKEDMYGPYCVAAIACVCIVLTYLFHSVDLDAIWKSRWHFGHFPLIQ